MFSEIYIYFPRNLSYFPSFPRREQGCQSPQDSASFGLQFVDPLPPPTIDVLDPIDLALDLLLELSSGALSVYELRFSFSCSRPYFYSSIDKGCSAREGL